MEESNDSPSIDSFYSIRISFNKPRRSPPSITVYKRQKKRGKTTKENFPFPENIKYGDLSWKRFNDGRIATYHRMGSRKYKNEGHIIAPTILSQRLEELVQKAL